MARVSCRRRGNTEEQSRTRLGGEDLHRCDQRGYHRRQCPREPRASHDGPLAAWEQGASALKAVLFGQPGVPRVATMEIELSTSDHAAPAP